VHEIPRETGRRLKDTKKAVEDTGLLDSSLKSSLPVLNLGLRSQDTIQILSVFCRVDWGEVLDVDIRVITRWIIRAQKSKQGWIIMRAARFTLGARGPGNH
jgi:hypothetical protein